jgi:hypothetical protein
MVYHLFFSLTVFIRSWVLFPTLCGSINTKSMQKTISKTSNSKHSIKKRYKSCQQTSQHYCWLKPLPKRIYTRVRNTYETLKKAYETLKPVTEKTILNLLLDNANFFSGLQRPQSERTDSDQQEDLSGPHSAEESTSRWKPAQMRRRESVGELEEFGIVVSCKQRHLGCLGWTSFLCV